MAPGDWVGIGALFLSLVALIMAYLRQPALVPAARVEDLRELVRDLREENGRLIGRITALEAQIAVLQGEAKWWQEEYRKLRGATSA